MPESVFQELDVVALIKDVPEHHLLRGHVGTVVHAYSSDAFEVEFVNAQGHTYGLATLNSSQLLRLRYEPALA